jgi:hypothetical protein
VSAYLLAYPLAVTECLAFSGRFGLCAVPSINTYVIFAAGSVLVSHAAGLEGDGSNIALASYWLRQVSLAQHRRAMRSF